jgi:nucleoside-diphosphate-sugar epimerase
MRIVVTGGSGRLGRFIVQDLHEQGHEVTSLDIRHPAQPVSGVRTIIGDASEMEDAFGAIAYARAEALVHFGAWSDPGFVPDSVTFADNAAGTFNLLTVCATTGVKRAIVASSAQVYGFAETAPVFAPVDESHPLRPLNSYALSKICNEQTAAYFAARHGLEIATLRIMGARAPADLDAEVAALKQASPAVGRFLLWNRSDARDVARACRLALTVPALKSGVYNITAKNNALGIPSADLLKQFCPATKITGELVGTQSILSCQKARDAFGYEAQYR